VVLVGCGNPESALRDAAIEGNIEVVKQHISDGVDVNVPNTYGWTALYFAASRGHKEVVELLIANGADVNQTSDRGITPLDGAIDPSRGSKSKPFIQPTLDRYPEVADLLRNHGGKTGEELKALLDAVKNRDIKAVKKFLPAGSDVNLKVSVSRTPLHEAARSGSKKIAELLIAKGADVNAKDKKGGTPLHFATGGNRKEIVELLIDANADVNAKDHIGGTPLDVAIQLKHPETTDLLRKHGGRTGEELKAEGK
jgi:ankyrin repeat protein